MEAREAADDTKERDCHECQICDKRNKITAHHIVPRSKGGADSVENLITLCTPCHTDIHRRYDDGTLLPVDCLRFIDQQRMRRKKK